MTSMELQQLRYGSGASPRGNTGYQPLVQEEEPPRYQPRQPVVMTGYTPVPPQVSQQGTNTAVVVTQPSANPQPTTVTVNVRTRAREHFIFTVILMAICCSLGGVPAFVCLCPAFIFATMAFHQNNIGDHQNAKSLGIAACVCNILSLVLHILLVIAIGILVLVAAFRSLHHGRDDSYPSDVVIDYECHTYYTYYEPDYYYDNFFNGTQKITVCP